MARKKDKNGIRIFLVRHGETEWNRTGRFQGRSDVPLNEEGKTQAQATALALKDTPFDAIYASPLSRALETAEIIKTYHPAVPLTTEEDFIEMALGDFDGMESRRWFAEYSDFAKAWRDNPGKVRMPGPGGECLAEVQLRAMTTLEKISQSHPPNSTLAICSHNFVILSILCHAKGISLDRFRELRQNTAAYSVIRKDGNQFSIEVMNEQSHLKSSNVPGR